MAFQLRRTLRQCRKVVGAMSQPKWEYVINPPPLPIAYYQAQAKALTARVATREREIDAVRTELLHAIDALPRRARERYTREREARGGPLP